VADDAQSGAVFRALADGTRRQILLYLHIGELAAGDIAKRFPISGPSVSRHLAVLRSAGLVTERRAANRLFYSLERARLNAVLEGFLAAFSLSSTGAETSRPGKKHPKRSARKGKGRPEQPAKSGPKQRRKDRGVPSAKIEEGISPDRRRERLSQDAEGSGTDTEGPGADIESSANGPIDRGDEAADLL
jgi:DNA-binding transcriptional ArsR family regulator